MQEKESYHGCKVRIEKSVPRNHCLASVGKGGKLTNVVKKNKKTYKLHKSCHIVDFCFNFCRVSVQFPLFHRWSHLPD